MSGLIVVARERGCPRLHFCIIDRGEIPEKHFSPTSPSPTLGEVHLDAAVIDYFPL